MASKRVGCSLSLPPTESNTHRERAIVTEGEQQRERERKRSDNRDRDRQRNREKDNERDTETEMETESFTTISCCECSTVYHSLLPAIRRAQATSSL